MLRCRMLQLIFLIFRSGLTAFRSRREVALENLVLRHQLQVALRTNPAPRLRSPDRVLWVWVRRLWPGWRDHLLIVKPATVIRWHRKRWRLYWTWKSRNAPGRPRLSAEVRELIGTMSGDNRLWGTERIRGELLKLGIVVSKRSIRRYRWCKPTPGGSQTWRTFLSNQLRGIWAADLLVVHTINYRVLYVLFFISHDRRELIHFNVTPNPTAAWVWQQLIEATPWGRQPKYLIHDRDAVYGRTFGARLGPTRHRQRSDTGPGSSGERHRRARRALNTHGVSGPRDRHQRATPACSPRRVSQLLQQRPATPEPRSPKPAAAKPE